MLLTSGRKRWEQFYNVSWDLGNEHPVPASDFSPCLLQRQAVVLLWQSMTENCLMSLSVSELHYTGLAGYWCYHPVVGISKYHPSTEIAANELGLWVMWTLFVSDSWQLVGVGLDFRSHIQISMEEVTEEWRVFLGCFSVSVLFFFNQWGLDKGLSSQEFFIWLLALKIPGDPHCALQRPKCRSGVFKEHTSVIFRPFPCATSICVEMGTKKSFLTCRMRTLLHNSFPLQTVPFALYC